MGSAHSGRSPSIRYATFVGACHEPASTPSEVMPQDVATLIELSVNRSRSPSIECPPSRGTRHDQPSDRLISRSGDSERVMRRRPPRSADRGDPRGAVPRVPQVRPNQPPARRRQHTDRNRGADCRRWSEGLGCRAVTTRPGAAPLNASGAAPRRRSVPRRT